MADDGGPVNDETVAAPEAVAKPSRRFSGGRSLRGRELGHTQGTGVFRREPANEGGK